MGTNYYHRYNICFECKRYDKRHIGKISAGWQFSFRGYNDNEGKPIISSWHDWKNVLSGLRYGRIFDEYGREITLDNFIAMIERTKGKQNYYDYLRDSPNYGSAFLKDVWKDEEGWDFTSTGFE